MSRIFLWFFSLYAVILLQICLKKKTQRLRHFTLVLVFFNTEWYTLIPLSVTWQTGGVEPLQGISLHSESAKQRQQGVIQYFAYT